MRAKTPCTFVPSTLPHASAGKSSIGAPHVAPALLKSRWTRSWRAAIAAAKAATPSGLETSAGIALHGPCAESSAAVASQVSALREEMITSAPARSRPSAIIRPMPRDPPVTTATLPLMSNRPGDSWWVIARTLALAPD